MLTHERVKSRRKCFTGVLSRERERTFTGHREIHVFLETQADHVARGEQAALSKLSETEYHTRLFLEEPKNHLLSETRSEMNMQESRVESADRALRRKIGSIQICRTEKELFNKLVLELFRQ